LAAESRGVVARHPPPPQAVRHRQHAVGFIFDGKLLLAAFCRGARGFTKKISQLFPEDVTVLYYTKMGNPA